LVFLGLGATKGDMFSGNFLLWIVPFEPACAFETTKSDQIKPSSALPPEEGKELAGMKPCCTDVASAREAGF
jgi:hypothetical protein